MMIWSVQMFKTSVFDNRCDEGDSDDDEGDDGDGDKDDEGDNACV